MENKVLLDELDLEVSVVACDEFEVEKVQVYPAGFEVPEAG